MSENINILRERKQIEADISAIKKKGLDATDAELKQLQQLEDRKKSIAKAEAQALKERNKLESISYSLQSKVSSLQEDLGKKVKRNGRYVFEMAKSFRIAQSNMAPMIAGGVSLKNTMGDMGNLVNNLSEGFNKSEGYLTGNNDKVKELNDSLDAMVEKGGTSMYPDSGDAAANIKDRFQEATDTMGTGFANVMDLQSDSIGLAKDMALNYDKVGTEGFSSSLDKAEQLAEHTKRMAKITRTEVLPDMKRKIAFMIKEAKLLPKGSKAYEDTKNIITEMQDDMEDLEKSTEEMVKTADRNVAQADQMRIANEAVARGAELILGPFQKLQGLLESAPGGKFFSSIFDVEGKMKSFTDTVQKNLLGAVTPDQAYFDETANRFRDLSTGKMISKDDEKVLTITQKVKRNEDGSLAKGKDGEQLFEPGVVDTSKQLSNIMQGAKDQVNGLMTAMPQVVASLKLATKAAFKFAVAALSNPYIAIAAAIVLVGVALYKAFSYAEEMRKEFGATREESFELQRSIDTTAMNFKMMGVSAEDVKTLASGIADNMGGLRNVTTESLDAMANLVGTFGMSAEKLAPTLTAMKAMGASSNEAAAAQLEQVGNMAQLEGVAPAKVFEDMTADMETFSKYGKEGGMNLAKASITARKLGISMGTIASSADALLDYESSINAQMEAQVLTGRNINTDKARELALAGDLEGQAREIAKQVGTQAEFDKMNVVQREAMAKAFGMNVQDMAKMIANQEELNSLTATERAEREASQKRSQDIDKGMKSMGAELGKLFNEMMEPLKQVMVLLGPTLGVVLKLLALSMRNAFMPIKWALKLLNPVIKIIAVILGYVIQWADAIQEGVGKAFEYMKPTLMKIGKIILLIIMPQITLMVAAVRLMIKHWDTIKPILMSIGKFALKMLLAPLMLVWTIIKTIGKALMHMIMIPIRMFQFALNTIRNNWDSIKSTLMTVGKIVGAVLFPGIALVAGIGTLIYKNFDLIKQTLFSIGSTILKVLVSPFVNMYNMIKMVGQGLHSFFMSPIQSIKSLISNLLPNWALKLLGMGGEDKAKEASFDETFKSERDAQGAGGEFEYKGKQYSTNYKEEGYGIKPQSSLAGAPKSSDISGTRTITTMRVQQGQVTAFESVTKEIKRGNEINQRTADSTALGASQTRKLNSNIATG